MKNALNNQVGMLGDMFLWLVARGHLLHKTGTPPKQISRECKLEIPIMIFMNVLEFAEKSYCCQKIFFFT